MLDPDVLTLADRVDVQVDAESGRFGPALLSIRTRGGVQHTLCVQTPPGTPAAPLSPSELNKKALAGFTNAAKPMTPHSLKQQLMRGAH